MSACKHHFTIRPSDPGGSFVVVDEGGTPPIEQRWVEHFDLVVQHERDGERIVSREILTLTRRDIVALRDTLTVAIVNYSDPTPTQDLRALGSDK